jgi:hypothetical protein
MSLFVLIAVLFLGVASIAVLIYRFLIAGQRNQTYGTIVVRRKGGKPDQNGLAKAAARIKGMVRKLTQPIDWGKVGGGSGLINLADAQTQSGRRK